MSKKTKKIKGGGLVYSTDPDTMESLFSGLQLDSGKDESLTVPGKITDKVRVWIDRKSRGGKEVTVIEGIQRSDEQLRKLATLIKAKCGVGGSAKDGQILIQGNQRDKVLAILWEQGFNDVKKAGG
jgi:translation initiation factor 1